MKVIVSKLAGSGHSGGTAIIEFWNDGKIVHEESFGGRVNSHYEREIPLSIEDFEYAECSGSVDVTFEWELA